ncbi:DUF6520 family protein [Ferruginibacter sp. HRS2-29]|uniref:DUF6520 family protein n=1 Tax=Ferruginibacter sp. HRS2-29 TaxID=2487334 RepID=UPI0020CDFF8B|nr:DUF6520 family protein [Ferruginibacter sp. HRS2-29]MCP9750938.1 hypothetical protein [Ferruginibacter sp. HRS2-29]
MKKQLLLSAFAMIFTIGSVFAQQENRQMPTPEQRVESALEKMAPLNLTAEQAPKVKVVLTNFFSAQQKAFEEMRAAGGDRDAMKLKNEELTKQRDVELKLIMTEEQYTKFQNEIVPSLRPKRNPKPGAN